MRTIVNVVALSAVICMFFFCLMLTASITGSVISATVLRGNTNISVHGDVDVTSCGAFYCPWSNSTNPNLNKPPDSTVK